MRRFGLVGPLALAIFSTVAHADQVAFRFSEERTRSQWDRGCPDWPERLSSATQLEKNPDIQIERAEGQYRVLVRMRVRAEKGESFERLQQTVARLLLDGRKYPAWVLPGLNEKPQGGSYFVSVNGMAVAARLWAKHFVLTSPYTFQVLWLARTGESSLEMRHDVVAPPMCDLFSNRDPVAANIDRVVYRMTPRPEILKMLMAEVYVLPQAQRRPSAEIELRMRLVARPSSLVYSLLPAKVMIDEVDARGRKIFSNFLELRKSVSESALANADSETAPKTLAAPLKKGQESRPKRAVSPSRGTVR